MPLELRPATEADAARGAEIEALAYGPNPHNRILFPGPLPPEAAGARVAQLAAQIRGQGDGGDKSVRWLKVVDADLEGAPMVSWARWHIYTDDDDNSGPRSAPRTFGPGCNAEACELLFGGIDGQRERLMGGRPYVYLKLLQTDPKHQGRGAGGMLVKWGVEEAKRRRLPAYLEATEAGHALYQKCGFRDLELLSIDFSRWGATEKHDTWAMVYGPSA